MYKSMKLNFICNFIIVKYLIILSFIPAYIISQNNFPDLFMTQHYILLSTVFHCKMLEFTTLRYNRIK